MKLLPTILSFIATTFIAEAATILPKFVDITNTVNVKLLSAQFTPYVLYGTSVVINPANGNLQTWTITNVSWIGVAAGDAAKVESIRVDVQGSNTINWTNANLSNYLTLTVTNLSQTTWLFDHSYGTNLWWGYRFLR